MSKVFCSQCLYFKEAKHEEDEAECHLVVRTIIPDTPIHPSYTKSKTVIGLCVVRNKRNDCLNYEDSIKVKGL